MKWLSRWVAKKYVLLWIRFKEHLFTYIDTTEIIKKYPSNYLNEIKKANALYIFKKEGKKRFYRLISPNILAYSWAQNLNIQGIEQSQYSHLILKLFYCLKDNLKNDLLALGIYGSVARGTARKDSDLDVFLITDNLDMTLLERTNHLLKINKNKIVQKELNFLQDNGFYPKINYYIRNVEELSINYFSIDISFDLQVIFDQGIMKKFLQKNKEIIKKNNIERKYLDGDKYYLDLKIKFGEIFNFGSI